MNCSAPAAQPDVSHNTTNVIVTEIKHASDSIKRILIVLLIFLPEKIPDAIGSGSVYGSSGTRNGSEVYAYAETDPPARCWIDVALEGKEEIPIGCLCKSVDIFSASTQLGQSGANRGVDTCHSHEIYFIYSYWRQFKCHIIMKAGAKSSKLVKAGLNLQVAHGRQDV